MATIRLKNNGAYEVIVSLGYDGKGKKIQKSKTFTRPEGITDKTWDRKIEKLASDYENKLKNIDVVNADIPLEEFTEKWLNEYAKQNLEQTTIDFYKRELRNKILPALGHKKLHTITPLNILSYLNNLLEDGVRIDGKPGGYSDRTVKNNWLILSSIFQQAVYWQVIPDNPCRKVKVPKNKNNKNRDFSEQEIKYFDEVQALTLLEIVNDEVEKYRRQEKSLRIDSKAPENLINTNPLKYKVAINIALFCGLRNGEILGLTWDNIDFKNNTITVNKVRAWTDEEKMITKAPKTESSSRTISVPDSVMEILKEYQEEQEHEIKELGDIWDPDWYKTPWLFTQWDGKGMFLQTICKWLKKVIQKYNKAIMEDENIKDEHKASYLLPVLSIHKLRHTSATLLIGHNTDIRTVSARLGHSLTSTTMDIYVHGLQSIDKKASQALEDLFDNGKRKLRVVK